MKYEAIGVIETQFFAVAMEMLDQVSKGCAVEFLTSQNQLGGKLVSIVIGGNISDVSLAIDIAKNVNERKKNSPLKRAVLITNPHPEILKYVLPATLKGTRKRRTTIKRVTKTSNKPENIIEEEKNDE